MTTRFDSRRWARWVATLIGFPFAGVAARAATGNIDTATSAAVGGLAAGAALGAAQAWIGGMRPVDRAPWVVASALGFAVGLTAGAGVVSYETDASSLAVMGALTGAGVGIAQALSIPMRRVDRVAWAAATPVLWTAGWLITAQVIVDADRQHAAFGSSGALVVAALSGVLVAIRQQPAPSRVSGSIRRVVA